MRPFLTIFLLITVTSLPAQFEFLNYRHTWTESYQCAWSEWTESHRYTIDSLPTILNGTVYFELLESQTLSGDNFENTSKFIRTDDSSRVFFYDGILEILLYDFTLTLGDTFEIPNGFGCSIVVGDIDTTILENGEQRRKWIFYVSGEEYNPEFSFAYPFWIEGIGNQYGLFGNDHMCQIDGCGTFLLCTHYLDTLIYQGIDWLDSCWLMISPTVDLYESSIRLFPNPAVDILTISDAENLIEELTIVNAQGNKQYNYNKNEFRIDDLIPGYYLVKMVLKDGAIVFRQFIKL